MRLIPAGLFTPKYLNNLPKPRQNGAESTLMQARLIKNLNQLPLSQPMKISPISSTWNCCLVKFRGTKLIGLLFDFGLRIIVKMAITGCRGTRLDRNSKEYIFVSFHKCFIEDLDYFE